uniref:F-box domain-containing protein n=1 Tax=Chromera velia CCMP2878 TaxID=1169474 RepID=A0A0G4I3D8_9ALVE|eukprot:Cvel_10584.t1-p1 / transcript=Cvel_10584.t1 / gene=Cvel_10584 / organism=Chromera_velia_CCMP2878 / gene_product=hypothetical protein / transcript_product=hypothetical protein / location=Cvel_scaffold642:11864-15341(-) / protein_length=856 / sequence_SO=supercontig / SO=protein_coding / is_pseudo=false
MSSHDNSERGAVSPSPSPDADVPLDPLRQDEIEASEDESDFDFEWLDQEREKERERERQQSLLSHKWDELPVEILVRLFKFFPCDFLLRNVSAWNRQSRDILEESDVWRTVFVNLYPRNWISRTIAKSDVAQSRPSRREQQQQKDSHEAGRTANPSSHSQSDQQQTSGQRSNLPLSSSQRKQQTDQREEDPSHPSTSSSVIPAAAAASNPAKGSENTGSSGRRGRANSGGKGSVSLSVPEKLALLRGSHWLRLLRETHTGAAVELPSEARASSDHHNSATVEHSVFSTPPPSRHSPAGPRLSAAPSLLYPSAASSSASASLSVPGGSPGGERQGGEKRFVGPFGGGVASSAGLPDNVRDDMVASLRLHRVMDEACIEAGVLSQGRAQEEEGHHDPSSSSAPLPMKDRMLRGQLSTAENFRVMAREARRDRQRGTEKKVKEGEGKRETARANFQGLSLQRFLLQSSEAPIELEETDPTPANEDIMPHAPPPQQKETGMLSPPSRCSSSTCAATAATVHDAGAGMPRSSASGPPPSLPGPPRSDGPVTSSSGSLSAHTLRIVQEWRARRGFGPLQLEESPPLEKGGHAGVRISESQEEQLGLHRCSGQTCRFDMIGDLYLCRVSGNFHLCGQHCRDALPSRDGYLCEISGQCFSTETAGMSAGMEESRLSQGLIRPPRGLEMTSAKWVDEGEHEAAVAMEEGGEGAQGPGTCGFVGFFGNCFRDGYEGRGVWGAVGERHARELGRGPRGAHGKDASSSSASASASCGGQRADSRGGADREEGGLSSDSSDSSNSDVEAGNEGDSETDGSAEEEEEGGGRDGKASHVGVSGSGGSAPKRRKKGAAGGVVASEFSHLQRE